jgi:hypothetical protein
MTGYRQSLEMEQTRHNWCTKNQVLRLTIEFNYQMNILSLLLLKISLVIWRFWMCRNTIDHNWQRHSGIVLITIKLWPIQIRNPGIILETFILSFQLSKTLWLMCAGRYELMMGPTVGLRHNI